MLIYISCLYIYEHTFLIDLYIHVCLHVNEYTYVYLDIYVHMSLHDAQQKKVSLGTVSWSDFMA